MIYSLQFTDETLNSDPQAREWIERVNAQLREAQLKFATDLTAQGHAELQLHAQVGTGILRLWRQ